MLTIDLPSCWRALRIFGLVLLGGCAAPIEMVTPLAEPGTYEIDQRLLGTWYGISYRECADRDTEECSQAEREPALLTMLQLTSKPGNKELLVRATALGLGTPHQYGKGADYSGRVRQIEATAHPAVVNGVTYYNIRRHAGVGYDYTAANQKPHYMLARVKTSETNMLNLGMLMCWEEREPASQASSTVLKPNESDVFPDVVYGIDDIPREQLVATIRDVEECFLNIGPFRRLAAGFDVAGPETVACASDCERGRPHAQRLASVALALAKAGLSKQALESAQLVLDMDAAAVANNCKSNTFVLAQVAEAQASAGRLDLARTTIERVRAENGFASGDDREQRVLVRTLVLIGEFQEALALFKDSKNGEIDYIVSAQLRRGDRVGAMQTARLAKTAPEFSKAAKALASGGYREGAREFLAELTTQSQSNVAHLFQFGWLQMELGFLDEARGIAQQVARLESDAGLKALATVTNQQTPDPEQSDELIAAAIKLIRIAELQMKLGDLAGARQLIKLAFELENAAQTSPEILALEGSPILISMQVRLGDHDGARRTMEHAVAAASQLKIKGRQGIANEIANAYAAFGDIDKAMEKAAGYIDILHNIAYFQRRNGDLMAEKQTLEHAFHQVKAAASTINPYSATRWALNHVRAGQADAAAYLIALAIESSRGSAWKINILLDVSETQMEIGDIGGARTSALYAYNTARGMPWLEPCDADDLLKLLDLPELDPQAKQ